MLSDALYVQQSLINNLFYLKTLHKFCLNIQLSFFQNNQSYIEVAEGMAKRYEELREKLIPIANHRLPKEIIESDSFVTNYSLDCELLTEKLFGIDINTNLTTEEINLEPGNEETISQELLDQIHELNEDSLELTRNFIDFCKYLLDSMKENNIFSYLYPLIYTYMIEEASLYANDLYRIQQKDSADPTFVVNYEYWFSTSMKQACQFIIGLSDPEQISIITNADNYRKIFAEQMKRYKEGNITPEIQKLLNEESIEQLQSFIAFLIKIIEGILDQTYYFIIAPIFFDNLLTEAYYFLYLLKGTGYGIS